MNERAFVKDGTFTTNKNEYGVKNLFRYADKFFLNESEILDMYKEIPFLNGGLFDCLDKPDDNGKVQYVDGFSRNPKKQAIIPDSLFFSDEQETDLNDIYGTRNKTYKVKGLVKLLDSYKFTVTENTPLKKKSPWILNCWGRYLKTSWLAITLKPRQLPASRQVPSIPRVR